MLLIFLRLVVALIVWLNATIANVFLLVINYKWWNWTFYTMFYTDKCDKIQYYFNNPFYWALRMKHKSTRGFDLISKKDIHLNEYSL